MIAPSVRKDAGRSRGTGATTPPSDGGSAQRVHDYARAVVAGKVVTNRYVRLACERHLRDLETGAARRLRFDEIEASDSIDFFPALLRLEDGSEDGIPFHLADWQAFVIGSVEGWKVQDDDGVWVRRFRNAYVETGKGSGKTPKAAGLGLRGLTKRGVAAPEVYSAAKTRDQSMICWTDGKRMIERSPALQRLVEVSAHALTAPARSGTFKALSSEAGNLHGKRVYVAIIDEEHAHPDSDVLDAIRLGTKGQRDALIFRITNAGFDRNSICWQDHRYSVRILEGEIQDDAWFAFVCGLDMCDEHRASGRPEDGCEGCDQWTDEAVWPKANPNIGVTISLRYLRELVTEALGKPSAQANVKRLNFCIWTEGSGKWLDAAAFAALGEYETPTPLEPGRIAYGGLDLASTRDLTALALIAPRTVCDTPGHMRPPEEQEPEGQAADTQDAEAVEDDEEQYADDSSGARCYDLRARFWLPEMGMRDRVKRDHVPYDVWVEGGWIDLTPGNVTDYETIRLALLELRDEVQIRAIGHDRWNATHLVNQLMGDGFEMIPVGQGITEINDAAKKLESDIAGGLVHHDGNPVLRWMVGNAAADADAAGNIKPSRKKSTEKIDGVAAWCDALFVMTHGAGEEASAYEEYRSMTA